jgi:hypothetical protein
MDRVIETALADLSDRVVIEIGPASDPDKRAAVEVFRILYRAGYVFTRDDVEHWAIAHGWSPAAALRLGDIAEGVNDGRPFHVLSRGPAFPDGTLEAWEERARRRA